MRRPTRLLASIAAFAAAASTLLIAGAAPAQAVGGGLWKVDCHYTHSAADDPIVYPGQPGASHLHDFYGNISTNAYSTYGSMDGVSSTCTHNDRAAYWTPTLYRNGKMVHADGAIIYYDVRAYKAKHLEAFPKNFMMIAGNKNATTAAQQSSHVYWGCEDDSRIDYKRRTPPDRCSPSNGIMLRVEFPSCWDGVTVNGNEIDHMRYPSGGNCPKGYPHVFPMIGFHVTYQFHNADTGKITFSSGNVYSAHLDFWNTWDQKTLQTLVDDCLNTGAKYGPKCGHFKGNGGSPGKAAPKVDKTKSNAGPVPGAPASTKPTTPSTKPSTPSTKPSTPAGTGHGKGGTPGPCVTAGTKTKLALTSNNSPLTSSSPWTSHLASTAGAIAVGFILLFEGGVLVRRGRRRFARK